MANQQIQNAKIYGDIVDVTKLGKAYVSGFCKPSDQPKFEFVPALTKYNSEPIIY